MYRKGHILTPKVTQPERRVPHAERRVSHGERRATHGTGWATHTRGWVTLGRGRATRTLQKFQNFQGYCRNLDLPVAFCHPDHCFRSFEEPWKSHCGSWRLLHTPRVLSFEVLYRGSSSPWPCEVVRSKSGGA